MSMLIHYMTTVPHPLEHLVSPSPADFDQFINKVDEYLQEKREKMDMLVVQLHEKSTQLTDIQAEFSRALTANETMANKIQALLEANQILALKLAEMKMSSQNTSDTFQRIKSDLTEKKDMVDKQFSQVSHSFCF